MIVIKKGSLMDQLYNFPEKQYNADTDICTFTRYVLRGIFAITIAIAIGVTAILFLLEPWIAGLLYLKNGIFAGFFGPLWLPLSIISGSIQASIILYIVVSYIFRNYSRPPSIIAARYRAFKEKTCVLVRRV